MDPLFSLSGQDVLDLILGLSTIAIVAIFYAGPDGF